jgi:hypothetical protein
MITIPGDKTVYVDCDDTIVFWSPTEEQRKDNGTVAITCPGSMTYNENGEEIGYIGEWTEHLVPNWPQINALRNFKIRGFTIVLWTQSGFLWAEALAKALKIEQLIDVCLTKPTYIFDDLPASEFMPQSRLITKENR